MSETTERDFLSRQLIAYIGNKRRLLPFLSDAFRALERRAPIRTFLDPFSGSGAVSRLAKTLGYAVTANDWERYAWVVTSAHLTVAPSETERLFDRKGGIEAAFDELNRIGDDARGRVGRVGYLALNYAPERTETADYRRERLFYTAENARFLDAVRDRIEEWYPGWKLEGRQLREKLLLVSAVVYEAATHANTSGVFKACHKGFGGFGRDALTRILAPVRLELPVLWESTAPMKVERENAESLVAKQTADLCYLDPPYTIHQYGSNYHLLNTIVRWDKPDVETGYRSDGRLRSKAGIRPDWIETHSDFCVRSKASAALMRLLESIDSTFIVLSYNTEGIVPIEEVYAIMSRMGRTELMGTDYVLYRGGKQSLFRNTHNLEYLLVLQKGRLSRAGDFSEVRRFLAAKRLSKLLKASYVPGRIRDEFAVQGDRVVLYSGEDGSRVDLPMRYHHLFAAEPDEELLGGMATPVLESLLVRLERARCRDRSEEAQMLMRILEEGAVRGTDLRLLQDRLAGVLKKFAHRKYRELFEESCAAARRLVAAEPERYRRLGNRLEEIERVAQLRFTS